MTSSNIPNKDHHFLEMSVWGIKKKIKKKKKHLPNACIPQVIFLGFKAHLQGIYLTTKIPI